MLDGFDEISPFYNETVIDLLQGLRLKVVEQLWVNIRPHPREELEDNLQQLSYTLEPFSVKDHVETLNKILRSKRLVYWDEWTLRRKRKVKKQLEIYAKNLIKKTGNSISDKGREFTCNPLQSCMLRGGFWWRSYDFPSVSWIHALVTVHASSDWVVVFVDRTSMKSFFPK